MTPPGQPDDPLAVPGALAISPDGTTLASASWDCTVRLWPLAGGGHFWPTQWSVRVFGRKSHGPNIGGFWSERQDCRGPSAGQAPAIGACNIGTRSPKHRQTKRHALAALSD
jgi:hypothetical protein